MKTKREQRTTFVWNERDIQGLMAKHLFEETGVAVNSCRIVRTKIEGHESIVNYAVIIKEQIK